MADALWVWTPPHTHSHTPLLHTPLVFLCKLNRQQPPISQRGIHVPPQRVPLSLDYPRLVPLKQQFSWGC